MDMIGIIIPVNNSLLVVNRALAKHTEQVMSLKSLTNLALPAQHTSNYILTIHRSHLHYQWPRADWPSLRRRPSCRRNLNNRVRGPSERRYQIWKQMWRKRSTKVCCKNICRAADDALLLALFLTKRRLDDNTSLCNRTHTHTHNKTHWVQAATTIIWWQRWLRPILASSSTEIYLIVWFHSYGVIILWIRRLWF